MTFMLYDEACVLFQRERRSHWNILNGGDECPSDDSVKDLRLGGDKIKIKEINGGYCIIQVKEDKKNVNYSTGEMGTNLRNIWERIL